jgi:SAM-dependent methyltransferase
MDATHRFTNRVDDYVRYRPGYPVALIETLKARAGLSPAAAVADVGSGTGISTGALLGTGCTAFAVEPNDAMRAAAERRLGALRGFHSIAGTAEATTLPTNSVDLVTAGQAFHWFDRAAAKREFARILRPAGQVALFWNDRRIGGPFGEGYERLLETYGTDYREVTHRTLDAGMLRAFFDGAYATFVFPNQQRLDRQGLTGRLLSSSYAPAVGHPQHQSMIEALDRLFDAHQHEGVVTFDYDTRLYVGRLDPGSLG